MKDFKHNNSDMPELDEKDKNVDRTVGDINNDGNIKSSAAANPAAKSDEVPRDISPKKRLKRKSATLPLRIDNRSFLALLIRSFVSFMLISVLSVVLIFVLAIWLSDNSTQTVTPYLFIIILVVGIVAMLVASLIMYIRYINKHVQRPLKALGKAMTDFAQNKYRATLKYEGSKEFEQLVDSFNEMVALLNESEKQRDALEQDKQRMLAGLSHDLKTPITIIQGFSKAMRDGLVAEEDKQKYLNLIISKSENMGELVNELYEYSKLDHPDFKLSVENTDVAELARTYLAQRYDEFEIAGFNLEADIPENRLICKADKHQLTRVFENLTNNFFKYTPKGSTLCLRVVNTNRGILIAFADNGDGIAKDMYEDIFAPFVVGEQSRNKQGTGLGLAVCQKIVSAHGGKMYLNPTPLKGYNTEFDILLPHSFNKTLN